MFIGINMRMRLIIASIMVALLIGCASGKRDYQEARRKDTVEAYKAFLQKHPDAKQTVWAKARLAELEVQKDWHLAESTHTAAGYEDFIAKHPKAQNAGLAEMKLKELQAEEAWQRAEEQDTIEAYQNYLSIFPKSASAKAAMPRLEVLTAKRDWLSAQAKNSIEAYKEYLSQHPSSKYSQQAAQRIKPLLAEREWRMATAQNSEAGWVDYIVKYPDAPKAKDAIKRLSEHKMVKPGSIISWERLGGKTWSQPLEDGFSNYKGSKYKSVIVSRQTELTYYCKNDTELKFPHWVLLNNIKVTGHLKACSDGFRLVEGLALVPTKK